MRRAARGGRLGNESPSSVRQALFRAAAVAGAALLLQLSVSAPAQAQEPKRTTSMMLDRRIRTFLLADVLDIQPDGADRPVHLEGLGWIGGDYNRLYLRAIGERPTAGGGGAGDLQADVLYGRLISPFWTMVAGARLDTRAGPETVAGEAAQRRATRGLLALGLQGLAPYWLEMEPTLFVSKEGDVSARFETAFDLLFTQRLILQPRVELNAAVQRVPEFGIGSGLNDVEVGARMRYEIRRKFAPYVGVSWSRRAGGTAAMARANGEVVRGSGVVVGVRLWR